MQPALRGKVSVDLAKGIPKPFLPSDFQSQNSRNDLTWYLGGENSIRVGNRDGGALQAPHGGGLGGGIFEIACVDAGFAFENRIDRLGRDVAMSIIVEQRRSVLAIKHDPIERIAGRTLGIQDHGFLHRVAIRQVATEKVDEVLLVHFAAIARMGDARRGAQIRHPAFLFRGKRGAEELYVGWVAG